jgi:hypothetical protein
MKKVLAMAAVALFMMTSCSDDDSTPNNGNPSENVVLVKKMIEVFDGETITSTFTYNGTKIVKISGSDDSEDIFEYTGDLITRRTYTQGDFTQTDKYTYNSDNTLKTHVMLLDDGYEYGEKQEFTHNQDGTITVLTYRGDFESQTELHTTTIITMNNGNIVKNDTTYSFAGNSPYSISYTFDNKNVPFKNVTGYQAIAFTELEGGVNNVLTGSFDGFDSFEYTYNSNNYPETETAIDPVGNYETQYFYE